MSGGLSLIGVPAGVVVQTYSAGLTATSAINSAKAGLDIKAMKSEGGSSSSAETEIYDKKEKDEKLEKIELESREKRPTYRESEKDVYDFLDEKYKNNQKCRGTRTSFI